MNRKIFITANYGWEQGNRSIMVEIPEEEINMIEEIVKDFVFSGISYDWEFIDRERDNYE